MCIVLDICNVHCSEKNHPIAMEFNHDTTHGFITVSLGLQKSILNHFQVLNCLEETKLV